MMPRKDIPDLSRPAIEARLAESHARREAKAVKSTAAKAEKPPYVPTAASPQAIAKAKAAYEAFEKKQNEIKQAEQLQRIADGLERQNAAQEIANTVSKAVTYLEAKEAADRLNVAHDHAFRSYKRLADDPNSTPEERSEALRAVRESLMTNVQPAAEQEQSE